MQRKEARLELERLTGEKEEKEKRFTQIAKDSQNIQKVMAKIKEEIKNLDEKYSTNKSFEVNFDTNTELRRRSVLSQELEKLSE